MSHLLSGRVLIGAVVAAFLGVISFLAAPVLEPQTSMSLSPQLGTVETEEEFKVHLSVTSDQPVNVFAGELRFDSDILNVTSIDYNTSIADLWAEKPWYSNGDGTLNFAGGTTQSGGFTGSGELIVVTFRAIAPGEGTITLQDGLILQHNGLGTEVALGKPLDAIYIVEAEPDENVIPISTTVATRTQSVHIVPELARTDLNADGKQSIADLSIFMTYFASGDVRGDFNDDTKVTMADLSILLNTK